ncbi:MULTISPECIES: hypothetical protein [Dyella]|uniref:Uncharacterized protein n=2 Tax=Dyella TaxID=231454 RepID=A0A4R0YQB5_9GAMM|nr:MULTISPECIES: hypothetical protein [Dyella]TBR36654.1 hypothetical protein EYV96_12055 [Dyella terrae]TCI08255.1 hypothetical protein EZM97_26815 [Dyella soli]
MKQEIHVAGVKFIVDDPNGNLAQVQAHERKVAHEDCAPVEVTVREARERQAQVVPNTYDPIGSIRGRTMVFEAMADQRMGPFGLIVSWFAIGLPCALALCFIATLEWQHLAYLQGPVGHDIMRAIALLGAGIMVGAILSLPVRATLGYVRRRRGA